jgi:[ribosomal protein S5]-alanine N-acetyltransferase
MLWRVRARVPLSTTLSGPRLLLRAPRPSDVPELSALYVRNREHRRSSKPASPVGIDPTSREVVRAEVRRHRREWRADDAYRFCIFEDGAPAGGIALGGVQRGGFSNAYLGYWIDIDRQGRGLMTEAVGLVLGFAFEMVGLHRVQVAVMPTNTASRRVVAKAGFREEGLALRYLEIDGRWEDHVLHAITAEEPRPGPRSGVGTPLVETE